MTWHKKDVSEKGRQGNNPTFEHMVIEGSRTNIRLRTPLITSAAPTQTTRTVGSTIQTKHTHHGTNSSASRALQDDPPVSSRVGHAAVLIRLALVAIVHNPSEARRGHQRHVLEAPVPQDAAALVIGRAVRVDNGKGVTTVS